MLNVGDEVVLDNLAGDEGEYVGDHITEKGTITHLLAVHHGYPVCVKWENGLRYNYREKDLSLYIQSLENE